MIKSLISIAVLRFKLWFSGFDTTRIYIFIGICPFFTFLVLSNYHIVDSSHITFLAFKINHNWK